MAGRVCVGAIAGAFGVRGEARLKPFTAAPEDIAAYGPVESEDGKQKFAIRLTRPVKGGYAAFLSGVKTREAAEALKGTRLYVARACLPEPDDEEFYHADLIGLRVQTLAGEHMGHVSAIHDHGAGEFLEIAGSGVDHAVPFTRRAVPYIDLAQGVITIDLPEEN